MEKSNSHTSEGIAASVCGILAIILLFFVNIVPLILAVIAIVTGVSARNKGDEYGIIGLVLGTFTIILIIGVSALFYYWLTLPI